MSNQLAYFEVPLGGRFRSARRGLSIMATKAATTPSSDSFVRPSVSDTPKVSCRFETLAGQEMQLDFGGTQVHRV
jgi:hypothetical protein